MSPRRRQAIALAAVLWLGGGACGAADHASGLRHNPFTRPATIREPRSGAVSVPSVEAAPKLELRGTLLSHQAPLAIVGEAVIGIGEEVSGYRLVSVQEGKALLTRGDTRLVLSVDGDEGGMGDE
jgi:hypothetical protein